MSLNRGQGAAKTRDARRHPREAHAYISTNNAVVGTRRASRPITRPPRAPFCPNPVTHIPPPDLTTLNSTKHVSVDDVFAALHTLAPDPRPPLWPPPAPDLLAPRLVRRLVTSLLARRARIRSAARTVQVDRAPVHQLAIDVTAAIERRTAPARIRRRPLPACACVVVRLCCGPDGGATEEGVFEGAVQGKVYGAGAERSGAEDQGEARCDERGE